MSAAPASTEASYKTDLPQYRFTVSFSNSETTGTFQVSDSGTIETSNALEHVSL